MVEMNNISTSRDSPKTPGGISKSFLTPIRRVGLSRNWKNRGSSQFISPVSNYNSIDVKPVSECRKRKLASTEDEELTISDLYSVINESNSPLSSKVDNVDVNRSPTRKLLPKAKTLLLTKEIPDEHKSIPLSIPDILDCKNVCAEIDFKSDSAKSVKISKLSRANSNSQSKVHKLSLKDETSKEPKIVKEVSLLADEHKSNIIKKCDSKEINTKSENTSANDVTNSEKKSPNNLTKECVVVIQKNISKSLTEESNQKLKQITENVISQVLCDCDDVPLNNINEEILIINKNEPVINNDDEFQETKKVVKLQNKTTSISGLKQKKPRKKPKQVKPVIKIDTPSSQSSYSFDDDDDDDFVVSKKKTILIKKSYDKPTKLLKVKSTGSITQKDIDEIKERIERKKKLLLAKAMTNETAELGFIKKWQKACQNALTELCDLMKKDMPDKQNMDYAEMLQILKIPPELVGYDSENDCFNTPDDLTIILSGFNA